MRAPGILDGIVVALLISLCAGAVSLLGGGFMAYDTLFNLILCAATLIYLLYLLRRSRAKVGRVMVIVAWGAASLGCWMFAGSVMTQILLQAGFIWLTRSLYFHSSLWAAALDFGLVAAGLAAGTWALLNTASPVAALWSFFLIQALFCWIPDFASKTAHARDTAASDQSRFQLAHRVAIDAVRKLTQS